MATWASALAKDDRERFRQFIRGAVDVDAASPNFTAETNKVIERLHGVVRQYGHDPEYQSWAERAEI